MVIDISKIKLENIYLYELIGNVRKGQHLSNKEKSFLKSLEKPKERKIYKQVIPRIKLSQEEKTQRQKEYQHQYYLKVTKLKRKLNKLEVSQ